MTKTEQQEFAVRFLEIFLAGGFGSLTKREVELAVFYLLRRTSDYQDKSNYELATMLRIPEYKVKSLRLTSALKYETINRAAILGDIVIRLAANNQYANFDKGKVEISLEDPIEKRELEQYLKSKGHHAEYTINSEILRIAPVRLFELIVDNMENGEAEFDRLVREHLEDTAASERILEGAPSIGQKLTRLRKEVLDTNTLVSLLGGAIGGFVKN
ncbi:hypothetical protein TI04_02265 [Achromatium sp. WMS2]|nr:hypothetical protein TI04_02265 [Achromatium sp. WMS2]